MVTEGTSWGGEAPLVTETSLHGFLSSTYILPALFLGLGEHTHNTRATDSPSLSS